jgi:diguanylate cyclase (GGDEF)-like protein
VLLPGAGPDRAAAVAEKLRLRVAAAVIDLGPARLRLTVSIGHASLAQRGEPGAALFERVDQALYRAKRAGRNRVCAG